MDIKKPTYNELKKQVDALEKKLSLIKTTQQLSRSTMDNMLEGCQIISREWKYIYVNDTIADRTFMPKEELLGAKFQDLWPGIEKTELYRLMKDCMDNGTAHHFENRFEFPDGRVGWFDLSIQLIPEGIFILSIDITNQKKIEKQISDQEKKFKSVFESANVAKSITTLSGKIEVNRAFCNLLGYTKKELENKNWQDITVDEDINTSNLVVDKLLKGKNQSARFEKRYLHKNGSYVWVDVNVVLQYDDSGSPLYFITTAVDITEKYRNRLALQESEELFSKTFLNSPVATSITKFPSGEIVKVNDSWCALGGFSENEAVGKNIVELGIISKKKRNEIINELKKNGSLNQVELKIKTKNKEIRSILTSSEIIDTKKGALLITLIIDITDQRKAEDLLKRNEEIFKLFIEHSPAAIAMFDNEMKYIFASQRYITDFNLGNQKLIGCLHYDVFPELPQRSIEVHKRCLKGATESCEADPFLRASGKLEWVRWIIKPWHEPDNSIGGIIFFSELITERKIAQEALAKTEERFAKAFHSSPVGFVVTNSEDSAYIEVNESFVNIIGYKAKELIGKTPLSLNIVTSKQLEIIHRELAEKGYLRNVELEMKTKYGKNVTILFSTEQIELDNKTCNISTVIDITARKKAEMEIKNLNLVLEQRVSERTLQLESKNKELQTFTYSVSHDLKAPLRGIDGYSKLLQDHYSDNLEDEAKDFVKNIREGTSQMNQLIEDLLTYSRLERSSITKSEIKLKSLIENILNSYSKEIEDQNINLETDFTDTQIYADYNSLSMSIRNLLDNAIKFTKGVKTPTISVALEEGNNSCTISIKDNGIGFNMKYHDKIFDIFQRLHRIEDYPGTGIGLALVAKAMRRMDAKVWAQSEPGNGAIFYLELKKTSL